MLFPNHPAYAEIRAGMGYQPGAHALLGYAAPWHGMKGYEPGPFMGLGAFSQQESAAALNAGVLQQSDLDLLSSVGATDVDLINLIDGDTTLAQLYAQYGVTIPPSTAAPTTAPASASVTPQGPTAQQAFGSAGQLPTGSQISYTAGWSPIHGAASDVQAALSTKLPSYGMQLLSFNSTGTSLLGIGTAGFTATIAVTGSGFALVSDAQSILVTIVQSVIGSGNLTTNQASVVSTPSTPAVATMPAATNPVAWLENNAIYIGAAVAALVLLNNFTGRRR